MKAIVVEQATGKIRQVVEMRDPAQLLFWQAPADWPPCDVVPLREDEEPPTGRWTQPRRGLVPYVVYHPDGTVVEVGAVPDGDPLPRHEGLRVRRAEAVRVRHLMRQRRPIADEEQAQDGLRR